MDNTLNKPAEEYTEPTVEAVDDIDDDVSKSSRKMIIISCAVFFLLFAFGLYKITENIWDYQPLENGYFPLSTTFARGESNLVMGQFLILMMMVTAVFGLISCLGKVSSGVKGFLSAVAVILAIAGGITLQNLNTQAWEQSLKTWVQSEYGIEYDHITQYHYAGEIGKSGGRGQPSVYITPPENIRYLTSENGQYVAELIPDTYASETVRVYEVSGEGEPKLLSPK